MIRLLRTLFFSIGLLLSVLPVCSQIQQVHILSVNDMHAAIDRFPQLAGVVDSLRQLYPDLLLLSAGDNRTGNPVNDQYPEPCQPMVTLMNQLGFNYSALGNHEFDNDVATLRRVVNDSNFRYLCANLEAADSLRLHVEPFRIWQQAGLRIALLGLVQVGEAGHPDAHPDHFRGLTFRDPFETVREYAWLRQVSDLFIVLSHLGYEEDLRLAAQFPEIDLIIGGHTHTKVVDGERVGPVLVTQAARDLQYATETTLTFETGKLIEKEAHLIDIAGRSQPDSVVQALVDQFNDNPFLQRVLTTAECFTCREELGCLMADAVRSLTQADIAIQNAGGVRYETKPAGDFTVADVYRLDPFGNEVIQYELTGHEVEEMLAAVCRADGYGPAYVSGIRYQIKLGKDHQDVRKIKLWQEDGTKFDRLRIYRVVMSSYLASVVDHPKAQAGENRYLVTSDLLMHYLEQQSRVDYRGVSRMKWSH